MTKEQKYKAIKKIWTKHATGKQNMIATFLPHANQKALFNELIEFFENNPIYPQDLIEDDIKKAVKEVVDFPDDPWNLRKTPKEES